MILCFVSQTRCKSVVRNGNSPRRTAQNWAKSNAVAVSGQKSVQVWSGRHYCRAHGARKSIRTTATFEAAAAAATGREWEARGSEGEARICQTGGKQSCEHGSRCQGRQARPSHQVPQSQRGQYPRRRCCESGFRRRGRTESTYAFIALWHCFQSAS